MTKLMKEEMADMGKDMFLFREEFQAFRDNHFHALVAKVDKIAEKQDSRLALFGFITAIITLITVIFK